MRQVKQYFRTEPTSLALQLGARYPSVTSLHIQIRSDRVSTSPLPHSSLLCGLNIGNDPSSKLKLDAHGGTFDGYSSRALLIARNRTFLFVRGRPPL